MESIGNQWKSLHQTIHKTVNRNYNIAVSYYEKQREIFINTVGNEYQDADIFLNKLNEQIVKEINDGNSQLEEQVQAKFTKIDELFQKNKDDKLFSDQLIEKISSSEGQTDIHNENYLKNYYARAKNIIDDYLKTTPTEDFFNTIKNTNNEAVANLLYAYARRLLVNSIINEKGLINATISKQSLESYKTALKGYYTEELVKSAFNNLFSNSAFQAKNTGIVTDEEEKQTTVDIVIGQGVRSMSNEQLASIIKKLEKWEDGDIKVTGKANLYSGAFGVQSKSWLQPWLKESIYTKRPNTHFLSVGSHSRLLPPGGLRSWHEGLILASQNMKQIIGPNVLYNTGAGVDWTADLITEFRKQQYWLAFYFSKKDHKATGDVDWEHEVSK